MFFLNAEKLKIEILNFYLFNAFFKFFNNDSSSV